MVDRSRVGVDRVRRAAARPGPPDSGGHAERRSGFAGVDGRHARDPVARAVGEQEASQRVLVRVVQESAWRGLVVRLAGVEPAASCSAGMRCT